MPQFPAELTNILIQGGFAALFIWLLLRTQDRQDKREDRLTQLLEVYSSKLPEMSKALESLPEMVRNMADLTRAVSAMEKQIDELKKAR